MARPPSVRFDIHECILCEHMFAAVVDDDTCPECSGPSRFVDDVVLEVLPEEKEEEEDE